jgi:hypothetical protein
MDTRQPMRKPRPLTERQCRARVQAALDELAVLGASQHLSAAQIRYRLIALQRQVRDMLERWPDPDRRRVLNIWAGRLARERSEDARR